MATYTGRYLLLIAMILCLILPSYGNGGDRSLGIDLRINPTPVLVGNTATITCTYCGEGIYTSWPKIKINGIQYFGTQLNGLPYLTYTNSVDHAAKRATVTLKQGNVSSLHNGTTYQCFFNLISGMLESEVSSLIVLMRNRESVVAERSTTYSIPSTAGLKSGLHSDTKTAKSAPVGSSLQMSIVSDEVSAINLTDHDHESASISTLVNANMHKKQDKETVIVATSVTGGVVLVSVGLAVLITTISVVIKCTGRPSHRKRDSEGGNREEAVYEEIQMTVNPGYEQIMFSSPQYDNL